jgi:glycosyltransferase involved in cell wall biosynthesis
MTGTCLSNRKKIGIAHPRLGRGGSEARPLWISEALKKDYDVSIITMGKIELNRFNKSYGTNLNLGEIRLIEIPIPSLFKKRFDALRSYRLARFCKQHASEFDLMISTYNLMDFGRRGIQFIADFSFDDKLRQKFHPVQKGFKGLFYQASPLRWMYLKLSKILSGTSPNGWEKNLTIANSNWSGKIMKENYGIETKTIYPPVASKFPDIPWDKRENGFVVLTRLSPEKRIEKVIEILEKARERENNIHLHILGKLDDSAYARSLKLLCKKNKEWISLESLVVGKKKLEFVAQHKFGISGCENEAFGIAVAEAVKAGCIVWVANTGGQVEIVNHPDLIYDSVEDAVNKIEQVLNDNALQIELREHLVKQAAKFSTERFMREIREIVQQFLKEKKN